MALVLDPTPGGVASNTYCTRAEADAYHEGHVDGAVWTAATTAQRDVALVQATRLLDAYVAWRGLRANTAQALCWPRSLLTYPDTGESVSPSAIPPPVVRATAEQARLLLAGDRAAELDATAQGLSKMSVGPVAMEFRAGAAREVLAPSALGLLRPYFPYWGTPRPGANGGAVALARK